MENNDHINIPVSFLAVKRKQPIYPSELLAKKNASIHNEEETVSIIQDNSAILTAE